MPTPTLTTTLFDEIVDGLAAAFEDAIGSYSSGYGLGDSSQPLPGDWGLSGSMRSLLSTIMATEDFAFISSFGAAVSNQAAKSNYQWILRSIFQPLVSGLAQACYGVGVQLSVASIVDIASFCAYYNIGAGGPWNALLPPQFQSLYGLVYPGITLPATCFYAPPITNMGQLSYGGSFIAGSSVDTTQYAGAAQIQAIVTSFAGTSGTLTVTGDAIDASGNSHTGRTWTVAVGANGTFTLVPTVTGDLCTQVTGISLPGTMSAGEVIIAGVAPSGRVYPPAPPADAFDWTSMPSDVQVLLWAASAGAPDGVVFPGVAIAGSSPPSDTRFNWWNQSISPAAEYHYNGSAWVPCSQLVPWSLLSTNFTAGTVGATGLYANPANPNNFAAGGYVSITDDVSARAFYAVTAMCATQVAAPTSPTLTAVAGSTGLAAGVYKVALTATNPVGETVASTVVSVTLTAGQAIQVSGMSLPSGASSLNVYMSVAANSSTLGFLQTSSGTTFDITALPGGGAAAPPSTNTTAGVLLTRLDWDTSASPSYVFSTANGAQMQITGPPGAQGAAGNPRSTTLNGAFTAGNNGTSYTIALASGTGGYFQVGDIVHIYDGSKSAYYQVTATATSSITATRLSVPSDTQAATAGYSFANATPIYYVGPIGAPGSQVTMQEDVFAVSGAGPYTLSYTPNGVIQGAYLDGRRTPITQFVISGDTITLGGSLNPASYSQLLFEYSH